MTLSTPLLVATADHAPPPTRRHGAIVWFLFVGAAAAVPAAYLGTGAGWALSGPIPLLVGVALVAVMAVVAWLGASRRLSAVRGLPLDEASRRAAFPFIALLLPAAFLPEILFGTPGHVRIMLVLSTSAALFALFALLPNLRRTASVLAWLETRGVMIAGALVTVHALVSTALLIARYQHFGSFLGEDTAYYNQIFWSTLRGEFFRGTLTQARYFDPPVTSEFAVHNSPVMLLLLPVYWLAPSFYTLLILRNLALSLSAIPLFLLTRDRLGGVAAVFVTVAYLASPNLLYQSINGFYPLQFAALFLLLTLLFFLRARFAPFVVALLFALTVREEIALTVGLLGLFAVVLRRRWPWIVVPIVLSGLWWYVSTEWIMVRSRIAMEDLDGFYQLVGTSHNDALATLVTDPWRFVGLVLNGANAAYLYEMLKPTAMAPLLSPAALLAAPTLALNCVIGVFLIAMRNVSYHYSLVATVCLFVALVDGLARLVRHARAFHVDEMLVRPAVAVLLIPVAAIGMMDAVRHGGGGGQSLIGDFLRKPYHSTAERIVSLVEPDAAVAAPNVLLPDLSYRAKLYTSGRLWRYNEPELDYVVVDTDLLKFSRADANLPKYEASIARIRNSDAYELVLAAHGFEVYRARRLRGGRSEARQ